MLIRPEDELEAWGKAQNLYLKKGSASSSKSVVQGEQSSEVVFKNISSLKGKQSVSKLINYVARKHHEEEEKKHEVMFSDFNVQGVIVCNELGHRLADHQIEKIKESWNKEFIEREDKGRTVTHFVFSSDKIKDPLAMSEVVQATLARTIGKEGYRYITSVHDDTKSLHCHVVVNTYNEILQRKLNATKSWNYQQRQVFAEESRTRGYDHVATMKKWRRQGLFVDRDVLQPLQTIRSFGTEEYPNPDGRKSAPSFFVELDGGRKIWGKDLRRLVIENKLDVGSQVLFSKISVDRDSYTGKAQWEVKTFTDKEAKIYSKQVEKQKLKPVEVKNFDVSVSKAEALQRAKDIARLELEIKSPTLKQREILKALKESVPKELVKQARSDYVIENTPKRKSQLKQLRYLESQHKKGEWKDSLTTKVLAMERATSSESMKSRLDALLPTDLSKVEVRARFEKQARINAEIRSIRLQRNLNPEKVPFIIERLKKEIPKVAIDEKSLIQLTRGLHKQTLPEFEAKLGRITEKLNVAIERRNVAEASNHLSSLYAELKGKPRHNSTLETIKKSKPIIDKQRKELNEQLAVLRQERKAQLQQSSIKGVAELPRGRDQEKYVVRKIAEIEKSLGYELTEKRKQKRTR
ncbi:relaxase/mobilization nuclease domain-containing protein [Vibrio sp. 10N.261.46.A3]|uniref:relaxase/mobilization nuclease domain-containing protein n=1 Tax=Vibrio sp. 10N.261.46.A3 TaxID=3229658 RepID=UPI0035544984